MRRLVGVATGTEAARALLGELDHQVELDDEQDRVEADEAGDRAVERADVKRRDRKMRRQHAVDRPRLSPVLGYEPA